MASFSHFVSPDELSDYFKLFLKLNKFRTAIRKTIGKFSLASIFDILIIRTGKGRQFW